jgi:predicted nucleic acid-binding Zn ribbon protein
VLIVRRVHRSSCSSFVVFIVRRAEQSGAMKPLNQAIPRAVAELLRDAPLSQGKVEFAWKTAVGPAVGRSTSVKLEGTALLVDAVSTEWARELKRSSGTILARLANLLGSGVVAEIIVRDGRV